MTVKGPAWGTATQTVTGLFDRMGPLPDVTAHGSVVPTGNGTVLSLVTLGATVVNQGGSVTATASPTFLNLAFASPVPEPGG